MRRPVWLAAGVAIGVGGTLWAEQRVRRQVRRVSARLSPEGLTAGVRARGAETGARWRTAVEAGRSEQRRREAQLWEELGADGRDGAAGAPPPPARARRPGGRTTRL